MLAILLQYFSSPLVLSLIFVFPLTWYFVNRRYVWFSIPLTAVAEVIINWDNLCYYESRGLAILFICVQIALMAIFILVLKAISQWKKRRERE